MSIAECKLDNEGQVGWRDRPLIPTYEPLQTALVHKADDSPLTGYPGREATLSILNREFYWPRMSNMVRIFLRNCDVYERTHIWRYKKRVLHKPLPIPERHHQEISIDFMTDLPAKKTSPATKWSSQTG